MFDQPSHSQHPAPACPQLSRPPRHWPKHCKRCFSVYPISKLYTDDMGGLLVWALLGNQYVMIAYHTDGNLILQQAFQTKADKNHISAFNVIMGQLAACRLLVDLNVRDMRPVQTSSNSSQSHGRLSSNLCCRTCTRETKPSG
jgi:hypothetical protein